MPVVEETYDIVVVGAGHAGCEAALAAARLGFETIMFTVSVDSIALMPCNPNVGGSSKGHLVRELDALGGEMGKNIDKTFIQSKMLNESKGPAVHSLRAQADKQEYTRSMRRVLENTDHLTIRQAEIAEILTAASAWSPANRPTTATSAELNNCCKILLNASGIENRISFPASPPFNISISFDFFPVCSTFCCPFRSFHFCIILNISILSGCIIYHIFYFV